MVENIHRKGILDFTLAPARIDPAIQEEARRMGEALVEGLDVIGILAVELFVGEDDRIKISEQGTERLAPIRPPLPKLKQLQEGQEIVLLMDEQGYVMEIATPEMQPSR